MNTKSVSVKELYEEFTKQADIVKNRYFELYFKYDSYMTVADTYKKFKFTYWEDGNLCFEFVLYDEEIPEKYFINTEEAFLELEKDLQDRALIKEEYQKSEAIKHEQEERAEYERLKIKFEGTNNARS